VTSDDRYAAAAYQGEPGAFSEDAAHVLVGQEATLLPCRSFEDVFQAVETGRARYGVLPIENTLSGSVPGSRDLLATRGLAIVGETVRRIRHALLACPGARLESLREVLSHPVALAQCQGFFRRNPHLEPVAVYDTAGAVELVLREAAVNRAAIASARAAILYGAKVIAERLEDHPENSTRFLLLARPTAAEANPRSDSAGDGAGRGSRPPSQPPMADLGIRQRRVRRR
jgi:prephenate dehydratase